MDEVVENRKRPKWVWFIFLWTIFGTFIGVFSFYVLLSGKFDFDAETQTLVKNLNLTSYILVTLGLIVNLAAVTALFMLRKEAYQLYWISLVVSFITSGLGLGLEEITQKNVGSLIFQLFVTVLIIGYAKRLIDEKILR